jgi:hypothetical protein
MAKGEFMSKDIEAGNLLKNSNGYTIRALFTFDRETEIGQIHKETCISLVSLLTN